MGEVCQGCSHGGKCAPPGCPQCCYCGKDLERGETPALEFRNESNVRVSSTALEALAEAVRSPGSAQRDRGAPGNPWISIDYDGDSGLFIEKGRIQYAVDGIRRTREEFFSAMIVKGHLDELHVALLRPHLPE